MIREIYCTKAPKKKAIATERKIPKIPDRAFSVFSNSANVSPVVSEANLTKANANEAPKSSKTIETVVDVGIPKELNISSNTISVTITARKTYINS